MCVATWFRGNTPVMQDPTLELPTIPQTGFIAVPIFVRPHQVSDLYKFAAQLADNADMAFPPLAQPSGPSGLGAATGVVSPTGATGLVGNANTSQVVALPDVPDTKEPAKPEAAKQPDGPPQSVPGTVDPTKFSGCRNVNEVVGLLWKDNGIRTVADARVAFDQIRASGECAAAKVVPEDGIDTRITRAIELLKSE